MEEQEAYLLITRYLNKQTSLAENEFLTDWITASVENEQSFEAIKVIWLSREDNNESNSIAALGRLNAALDLEDSIHNKRKTKPFLLWAAVAATVTGLVFISSYILFQDKSAPGTDFIQYQTKAGEIKTFMLSEGTKVVMGPKGKLKFPRKFEGTQRYVELTGEAYFEVSKNPHKPFIVHTKQLDVKVLGTHFNVDADNNQSATTVSLFEGNVHVNVLNDHDGDYALKPGQELVLDRNNHQVYQHRLDSTVVLGWMTKTLYFNNEKLSDAARKIEKMYGVKLVFDNETTADTRIYAQFKNDSLRDVMDIICSGGNLKYQNDGNKIYLSTQ